MHIQINLNSRTCSPKVPTNGILVDLHTLWALEIAKNLLVREEWGKRMSGRFVNGNEDVSPRKLNKFICWN